MSVVLVTLFFISGLVDSVAFNSWNCFVNMQTGKPSHSAHLSLTCTAQHSTSDTLHRKHRLRCSWYRWTAASQP
jgi:hypothetical protein